MISPEVMKSTIERLRRAAEESVLGDASFLEAMQFIEGELDADPLVRTALAELRAAGCEVTSSFAPRINIRIHTPKGAFALSKRTDDVALPTSSRIARVTQELKDAATAVISNSCAIAQLDNIVNEAVSANETFESIAANVENAGYEVSINIDLSGYAQVVEPKVRPRHQPQPDSFTSLLSGWDMKFLKQLRIGIGVNG